MKRSMAIGMVIFCFLMMTSGAAWSENRSPIPPNGTILDTNTGLIWLQNANCFGQKSWADAKSSTPYNLKSGSCGLTDGSKAGQWRLPTKDELIARQKNKQGFTNVQAGRYWSATEYYNNYAWYVSMVAGEVYAISQSNVYYVWPVRSL